MLNYEIEIENDMKLCSNNTVSSCLRKALRAAKMPQSSGILVPSNSGKWSTHPQVCVSSVLSTVNTSMYVICPFVVLVIFCFLPMCSICYLYVKFIIH